MFLKSKIICWRFCNFWVESSRDFIQWRREVRQRKRLVRDIVMTFIAKHGIKSLGGDYILGYQINNNTLHVCQYNGCVDKSKSIFSFDLGDYPSSIAAHRVLSKKLAFFFSDIGSYVWEKDGESHPWTSRATFRNFILY